MSIKEFKTNRTIKYIANDHIHGSAIRRYLDILDGYREIMIRSQQER